MSDTAPKLDPPLPEEEQEVEVEDRDPLHIGNLVEILSAAYGYTVGRVVYRDADMVRIVSQEESDRAIEFPMMEDGSPDPALDVQSIEVIEEQASDYYVDFLGARPGETLEFFTVDGQEAAPSGEVVEVVKSAKKDNIRLKDGRTIRFGGVGPKMPIAVVRVRTTLDMPAAEADAEEGAAAAPKAAEVDLLALLSGVLPTSTMDVVPTAERIFPDSMQREDLFQDLLAGLSEKQKTNPRRIRAIEREVDMAVALKNKVAQRDAMGRVTGVAPNTITTISEAVAAATNGLPAAIPIVEGARVLNIDADAPGTFKASDVAPRLLATVEYESETNAKLYEDGALPAGLGRAFSGYINDLLSRDQATMTGARPTEWKTDQDVIRTADLGKAVQGFTVGLPSPQDEEAPEVTIAYLSSDVTDRQLRVLTADRIKARRSGEQMIIAPTDPSRVVGHVMLPTKAALSLRPPTRPGHLPTALLYSDRLQDDNLPTVAATLRDLYAPAEGAGPLSAWSITPDAAADADVAVWLNTVLRYAVHPIDSMGPRTPQLLALLDTLGLENRDLAPSVKEVIDVWVDAAQKQWRDLLVAERTRIKALIDDEPERTFQTVTGDDSPVWPALRDSATLKELLEDIGRRNPTIGGAPLVTTAALLTEAQGDATPLVWSTLATLDARAIDIDPVTATNALSASRAYILRRKALRDIGLLSLRAEPEINPCSHVGRLEAIRNVTDVLNRSRLLRDFVEEYQSGRKGDWVTCKECSQECVCYHELMELEALAQPARMDAIMRSLLVRFGGERFEGKVICRNCGQGIQDIDYDDHVEFDDDGRPISTRSVLTEDQLADPAEGMMKREADALAAARITFASPAQQYLYNILTQITERGGFTLPEAAVRMIVTYTDIFVTARTPPEAAYEAKRRTAMTSAAGRISTKGGIVALPQIPTFAAWIDDIRIMALLGLTVIALQTATPPIVVNSPNPGCKYSVGGWPLDPAAPTTESAEGAFHYLACTVAYIDRGEVPWSHTKWRGDANPASRTKRIKKGLDETMRLMLVGDSKTQFSFTPAIRTLLTQIQSNAAVTRERAIVSVRDQLPPGFRPEPFPDQVARPRLERDPVPPVEAALAAGEPVGAMVTGIDAALRTQANAIISELHEAAQTFIDDMKDAKPTATTDSICCPVPLMAADRDAALLGAPENAQLLKARFLVRGGIPTATNAGTHFWPEQTIQIAPEIEQSVDQGVYFKLFLKYCYVGKQPGAVHEFGAGNVCRQCGLSLGKPLDLIDFGAEGAAILAAQEGPLKVEVTEAAFNALSDAVRRRKIIEERPAANRMAWRVGLEELVRAMRSRTDIPADEGSNACAAALDEVLTAVTGREDAPMTEADLAVLWAPLTSHLDMLEQEVNEMIVPPGTATTAAGRARGESARKVFKILVDLTEDPFIESPSAVQEYWCAKTQAASASFAVTEVRGARWMKISKAHNEQLNRVLTTNANWWGGAAPSEHARIILGQVAKTLGPLMRVWSRSVRPSPMLSGPWTKKDAQDVLRCLVLQVWRDAVKSSSWMYRMVTVPAARVTTAAEIVDWTRGLMMHASQQFSRYEREKVKKVLQQRAELERTSVVEEFSAIKDDDQRAAELIKKQLRIGRWGLAAKGFRKYDAAMYDAETEQRQRQGIAEPPVDPILLAGEVAPAAQDYGLGAGMDAMPEEGYNADQAADGDNY
jgi:hypothetical protein